MAPTKLNLLFYSENYLLASTLIKSKIPPPSDKKNIARKLELTFSSAEKCRPA